MGELDARTVGERLGLPESTADRLGNLPPRPDITGPELPDDAEASSRLAALGVPPDLVPGILAARPDPKGAPEVWWILDRTYRDIVGNLGIVDGFGGWPPIPASGDEATRHVYVWVFVAALEGTRRFHAQRGIPDELSRRTLHVIGEVLKESRERFGVSGLLFGQWTPPLMMRGVTYGLGRLAYDFGRTINMHIPGRKQRGPLDPAACDASIDQAREFALRHFPEHPRPGFCCHSWLLDPQLAEYLPADSNLIRFQHRFRLVPDKEPDRADYEMLGYVFGRHHPDREDIPDTVLEELSQDTTLRRAFVTHLRSGRHWYSRTGRLPTS